MRWLPLSAHKSLQPPLTSTPPNREVNTRSPQHLLLTTPTTPPLPQAELELCACFSDAGIYDLSSFSVSFKGDEQGLSASPSGMCLVTVLAA